MLLWLNNTLEKKQNNGLKNKERVKIAQFELMIEITLS